ncbi:unnamed protein product [Trichobilharzia regenti]|nr:unnamed protein product [Trichobilharzia regenti]
MSGCGKGGKGLGRGGAKRHRKFRRDNIQGITNPTISCLARRGGVKRISDLIYEEIHGVLKAFLENVIRDAEIFRESLQTKRKEHSSVPTLMTLDASKNPLLIKRKLNQQSNPDQDEDVS